MVYMYSCMLLIKGDVHYMYLIVILHSTIHFVCKVVNCSNSVNVHQVAFFTFLCPIFLDQSGERLD